MRAGTRWAICAVFALLTACGGGGGGGDDGGGSPPPGNPPPGNPPPGNPPPGSTNQPPQLGTTSFSGTEDTEVSGTLTATDPNNDDVTFERTGDPSSGTVVSFTAAGAFVYRPSANFNGDDSFAVRVVDSQNNATTGTVSINIAAVNDPPVLVNDVLRADGPQLNGIEVLGNDSDPDGDALTVTIEEGPLVGTAAVTSDRRVRIEGLPAGFRGLTRFRYRVTDSASAASSANVAVFVGTDPFRVVFAGETAGAIGAAEVYMTDFVSPPWRATLATQGSMRLRGFAASNNGATVVYRRENSGGSDLSFVRTGTSDATAEQQVRIALPSGFAPVTDANVDQFAVSPDGQWIAAVAGSGNDRAVFALNVASPMSIRNVTPGNARFATQPKFSANSQRLYFLASERAANEEKSLYRIDLGSSSNDPTLLSRVMQGMGPGSGAGDVREYSVSADERRVAIEAVRNGRLAVYFIDPASPGNEVLLTHSLAFDELVVDSTVGLEASRGGSTNLQRVGYTTRRLLLGGGNTAWVAEVGATPNARSVATSASAIGFRPDNDAMLYVRQTGQSDSTLVLFEAVIDSTAPQEVVGHGTSGVYDSTGNQILLRQALPPNGYPAMAAVTRGSFGSPATLGTPGQAAWLAELSGAERAVALLGEAPIAGAGPRLLRLSLVNARAPDKVLNLAEFDTPNDLTSAPARVVTY